MQQELHRWFLAFCLVLLCAPTNLMAQQLPRVAILGGGMGALSTAYYLSTGENEGKFNVTVYQMGWRLGGKASTGRNPDFGNRIEEQGIHMLFGFYTQVFEILSDVYNTLNRDPSDPLSSLDKGLRGQNGLCMNDPVGNTTQNLWCTWLPVKGADPWHRTTSFPRNADTFLALLDIFAYLQTYNTFVADNSTEIDFFALGSVCKSEFGSAAFFFTGAGEATFCFESLTNAQTQLNSLAQVTSWPDTIRRLLIELDILVTVVIGLIATRPTSFDDPKLDAYDFREWLLKYGLYPPFADSPPINAIYMTSFCYVDGDRNQPNFGAGVALHSCYNAFLTYEGHFGYYFKAGTGEVVFQPIWEFLKIKGVDIRFFHRVDAIIPDAEGNVTTIRIGVQAKPLDPLKGYDPLIKVGGFNAWPNQPNWEQLENGFDMKAKGYNFESYWNSTPVVETLELSRGNDFDTVVLAISVGALPYVATDILNASPALAASIAGIRTTPTYGIQLWFSPNATALGTPAVPSPNEFSMANYVVDLDGVADFSHILYGEEWPSSAPPQDIPQTVIYFCQAWQPLPGPHPFTEKDYPAKERMHLYNTALTWMNAGYFNLFTGAVLPDNTLNYDLLVDPTPGSVGVNKFANQFFITKVDPPTELYVLSAKQTLQYRLNANESGFGNLFLAGDWTNNALNYGCLEATVNSGQNAAMFVAQYHYPTLKSEEDAGVSIALGLALGLGIPVLVLVTIWVVRQCLAARRMEKLTSKSVELQ